MTLEGKKTLRLDASVESIRRAAEILREGGTVAFPTETVYGLGANALDASAVAKIFEAKQRPGWDPVIVHVVDRAMVDMVAEVSPVAERLMEAFWPGPLTLLLPRRAAVPDSVTAGRPLVGVRMPAHPVAEALIRAAGVPVAAPSANRFGHTSPVTAEHVLEDLDGRIDAVVDGGPTVVGVESTVLDAGQEPVVVYRPGAVTPAMLERVVGAVTVYKKEIVGVPVEALPSPGVGIRHYAPRAVVELAGSEEEMRALVERLAAEGKTVGVMLPEGWGVVGRPVVFAWGAMGEPEELARRLFYGLRELDGQGVEVIVCPVPEGVGVGLAVRDRLEKAAKKR